MKLEKEYKFYNEYRKITPKLESLIKFMENRGKDGIFDKVESERFVSEYESTLSALKALKEQSENVKLRKLLLLYELEMLRETEQENDESIVELEMELANER